MMRKKPGRWIWLFLILLGNVGRAQTYKYKADLDTIQQSGFYAFKMTPELSSMLKTDFRDLRINDKTGKPVPWLMASQIPILRPEMLRTLDIVQNTTTDSGQSVVIVRNDSKD